MAKKGEAHHGGAWKVAYADFVTAMMALFMVLWITAQDPKVLKATADYFRNPRKPVYTGPAGLMPPNQSTINPAAKDKTRTEALPNATLLQRIAHDFYKTLSLDMQSKEMPVDLVVTPDGLKINVYNRAKQPVFVRNTAELTDWGRLVLQNLAWLIDRHRFKVIIEGHTPTGFVATQADYGAWELTSDRANTARRALEKYAVSGDQIKRVVGYADTQPLPEVPATDEANARVTLALSLQSPGRRETVAGPSTAASASTATATPAPAFAANHEP